MSSLQALMSYAAIIWLIVSIMYYFAHLAKKQTSYDEAELNLAAKAAQAYMPRLGAPPELHNS